MINKLKNRFETPSKALTTVLVMGLLALFVGFSVFFGAKTLAESSAIGVINAQNFAYADAGVDATVVTKTETEFEFQNGQFVYDVEFESNGIKYEYALRAKDGLILRRNSKFESGKDKQLATSTTNEEAKAVAFKDAGVTASDVTITREVLYRGDNALVYKIKFHTTKNRYLYKIDVNNLTILDKEINDLTMFSKPQDRDQEHKPVETLVETGIETSTETPIVNRKIQVDDAKKMALADAQETYQSVRFTEVDVEQEDGYKKIEVKFITKTHRYEYEFNQETGAMIKRHVYQRAQTSMPNQNQNQHQHQNQHQQNKEYIGVARAKQIALTHAKLPANQVKFVKSKLDKEDGVMQYEIEFVHKGLKYEYEIDAKSGAVLEVEIDD